MKTVEQISNRMEQLHARIHALCEAKERDPFMSVETIELMKKEASENIAEQVELNAEMMAMTTQSANAIEGIN